MDWLQVIFAGLVGATAGALGAGLGALFVKDPAKKKWRVAFTVLPIVLSAQLGPLLAKKVRNSLSPSSRFETHIRKYSAGLAESPVFKARMASLNPEQARQAGQHWTHAGLKRLDADDLDAWNGIRLKLSLASKPLCAALWTGKLDPRLLTAELEKLSDPDLDAWARLSMKAMTREIESNGSQTLDPQALVRAIRSIDGRLSPADSVRFQSDLKQGVALPDDEACWALVTLTDGAAKLDRTEREGALRALASL
jgi:hypothetical protein